ncbi:MAG TPA: type VI secretion system tip protein TssI/VgrG [Pyrinomonadaceae bacterium]|jgi:type VI secretion system secreted protein VgrG|nr:type VI secretion system tip protein TssI/VgrG [Pyrinomonadaceae bacterium]
MSSTYIQKALRLTVTTPLGKDKLLLKAVSGEEQISGLFNFQLEMVSEDQKLDFSAIVGKQVTVTLLLNDGTKRYINGVVGRFMQEDSSVRLTTYYADIHPWLWMLTKTRDCRIFQNKTIPQIIKSVFDDLEFKDYRDDLKGTYPSLDYCVQYDESAFNFVSRLMEDAGIFYFFEHEEDKHTLVLGDDADVHKSCPGLKEARYQQSSVQHTDDHIITRCSIEEQVVTGKFAVDDFNFETPSTDLMVEVTGEGSEMRIYEYPGGLLKKDDGEKRARLYLEACEQPGKTLRGEGHVRAFTSGYKFDLKNHYRADANKTYVLRRVSIAATQDSYTNSFEAFPVDVPFRPQRMTPKPVIVGTQTAIVVGKSGEEIWTDKYGRIKVQFHWDQKGANDENSSCWIRVDYGWAGKQWGGIFLPRIGQEVIVSYLEGDPDRPLVTGAVYNAQQVVPYTLPDEQTKSTIKSNTSKGGQGFNEIRFEDKKDSEEMYFHAQKDQLIEVLNNRTKTVTKNEKNTIKGTRDQTVTGNETHTDEANFTHKVTGNYELKVTGNLTIDVTGSVTFTSAQSMKHEAQMSITNTAGTSMTNKSGTSMSNTAGTSMTNEAQIGITNKGSATNTVESSGITTIKGSLVKIN